MMVRLHVSSAQTVESGQWVGQSAG
jgi:hypothetical protein